MPSPEEAMYAEAVSALQSGNKNRARDLFTRLLKTGKDNPDYWVWMSAVVDTPKERIFCLTEALRRSPEHPAALRGLAILGQAPPRENQVIPARLQRRNWHPRQPVFDTGAKQAIKGRIPVVPFVVMAVAFVALVSLAWYAFAGPRMASNAAPTRIAVRRSTPTETLPPLTATPESKSQSATRVASTPLALLMKITQTPTPLYVNTPHGRSDNFRIGMLDFQKGDWQGAEMYLKLSLTDVPEGADILFYLGETYRLREEYATALTYYEQAIKADKDFAPAHLGRARALLGINPNNVDAAQNDLEAAVKIDPALADAYLDLGLLLQAKGETSAAQKALDEARNLMPDSAALYLALGRAALREGNASKALEYAQKANSLDLTLMPAYLLMGQALQAQGAFEKSIEPLTIYVTYQAEDAVAWYSLAVAQQATGAAGSALESVNKALEIDDQVPGAVLLRAQLSLADGRASEAYDDFKQAQRVDPYSFAPRVGEAQALIGMGFPGDAYVLLDSIKGFPQTDLEKSEWLYWRARSLEALKEIIAALRDYNSLIDLPAKSVDQRLVDDARRRVAEITRLTPTATTTNTAKPTDTRVPTSTIQPTATVTRTPTAAPTKTSTPTARPTVTVTPTNKPTVTPLPTKTPAPSRTPTP